MNGREGVRMLRLLYMALLITVVANSTNAQSSSPAQPDRSGLVISAEPETGDTKPIVVFSQTVVTLRGQMFLRTRTHVGYAQIWKVVESYYGVVLLEDMVWNGNERVGITGVEVENCGAKVVLSKQYERRVLLIVQMPAQVSLGEYWTVLRPQPVSLVVESISSSGEKAAWKKPEFALPAVHKFVSEKFADNDKIAQNKK